MTNSNRTDELRQLMAEHGLKAKDVGAIVGRDAHTVRVWASAYPKTVIPANMLRLLVLELQNRARAAE